MPTVIPFIPERITVHLGPPRADAPNVTVPFSDYIKNVASSEIYPTWEEAALRANILAITSFALNRVYTEFYRSRGFPFEITSSTAYDQYYVDGRSIFTNVARLVDELFNDYLRRPDFIEPLAAKFCNGTTVTCEGLSQWGSQYLAREGLDYWQILKRYYGDLEQVNNAPVQGIRESYPGQLIRLGSTGPDVVVIQTELNRIGKNYPAIPKIPAADGIFGPKTEAAVRKFQQIFNLQVDGIVGSATWYALVRLYTAVLSLSELESKGQQFSDIEWDYPNALQQGDRGEEVRKLQYMLLVLSEFIPKLPRLEVDGIFGPSTRQAVLAAQRYFGLPQTGVADEATWDLIYDQFAGIEDTADNRNRRADLPKPFLPSSLRQFPGEPMRPGTRDRKEGI